MADYGTAICEAPGCDQGFTKKSHNQRYHSGQCKRDVENAARRREMREDIEAAVVSAYEVEGETEQLRLLKDAHAKALRELEKMKSSRADLAATVHSAVVDGLAALDLKPIKAPKVDRRKKDEEIAVAVISDWQLAKTTPNYDSEVCELRIEEYAEKVIKLTNIQRADHPVRKLHIWALGDIVEGELIFPGQSHLIDSSLYRQVTIDGPRILGNFIRRMLQEFDSVHFVGVIGNHGALGGRARRDYDPETNADRMLYRIIQHIFADEPRITFNIPDGPHERNWYAIDTIGNYSTLLFHGDQIKSFGSQYGFIKKILGWKSGAIEDDFDDAYMGHYHQPTKMTLNSVTLRVSGSPESYNTYAIESLAAVGFPSQPLHFVHPENGTTCEYTVWLT